MSPENAWTSGVGGAQCDRCGETTIVKSFANPTDALDESAEWLCLPCWRGDADEPVQVNYCTCAGPCPGYPQHEHHCGWITAEEAGTG